MNDKYNTYMSTDLSIYTGEWVAISNKKVVSHGFDIKKVYFEAKKKHPRSRPLITKVPGEKTLIF